MTLLEGAETAIDLLPAAFTLFVCIYYITRSAGVDAILMLVGGALSMIMAVVWIVVWPMMWNSDEGPPDPARLAIIQRVLFYVGTCARLLFISGIFLLVMKHAALLRRSAPPPLR